jgi:hypothetical protein
MSIAVDVSRYIPGALHDLRIEGGPPPWVYSLSNVRDMHAIATKLTRDPHANIPPFALWPGPLGGKWWLWTSINASRFLSSRKFVMDVAGRERCVSLSAAIRVRWPERYEPGVYRARIETVTPVVIRAAGGSKTRTDPDAGNLSSTLGMTLAPRLGLPWIKREDLPITIIDQYTTPYTGKVDGRHAPKGGQRIGGDGRVRGWHGVVDVECNERVRWLLDCAELLGLGGRVAFGFGRIRVTEALR